MNTHSCILCQRDSNEVPIVQVQYRGNTIGICSQHFPVLIHDPGQLIGVLPGAESLKPSEVHD